MSVDSFSRLQHVGSTPARSVNRSSGRVSVGFRDPAPERSDSLGLSAHEPTR
jgi:hypothetical protein